MRSQFSARALVLFLVLLGVEIFIALYVHDRWVRPFVGDVLVVAVVFYLLRTFVHCRDAWLAAAVLLFAWSVEVAQYFDLVSRLGLAGNQVARIVFGSTFDPLDLLAYGIGAALVWGLEASCASLLRACDILPKNAPTEVSDA